MRKERKTENERNHRDNGYSKTLIQLPVKTNSFPSCWVLEIGEIFGYLGSVDHDDDLSETNALIFLLH